MEELDDVCRNELIERIGIDQSHWRYLPNRHVSSILKTTKLEPENIGYAVEILGSEYKDKKELKVLKESRYKEAINAIIEFYKQGVSNGKIRPHVAS
jgi:hypothetical protein